MEEGYIKFTPIWKQTQTFPAEDLTALQYWRQACYHQQWIGTYPDGIGFGNISERIQDSHEFYISGSATGSYPSLQAEHFARVKKVDAATNRLWCSGPILASSESMSHAVIYEQLDWVRGVIHVHHLAAWQRLLHQIPTTDASAPYGSPEMVASITHLLQTTDLAKQRIFVMEGHREGIFAFGNNLASAFEVLERYLPHQQLPAPLF